MNAGTRLGAYEVVSLIGTGGMGEVYRARDTRLNRDVAIKVLPDAFVHDADRLARFKREAQVLASLNHPHIAGIYGLEEIGGGSALVLELVEGPTLADRIARGPIPIDDALPIAGQIAEALEAAHEHGIIHRDLKPANIKLTADDRVKVLDFGLAKATDRGPVDGPPTGGHYVPNVSMSPTITSPAMTMGGVVLGTAAYMSPEQAKGKTVDKRSDIWAFGCVLYEMLAGKPVFGGQSLTEILASIVRDEPDWRAVPAATPQSVRRLLRRALQKDPRRRLADAADARIEIEEAQTTDDLSRPAVSTRTWMMAAASAAVIAVLATGLLVWMFATRRAEEPAAVTSFSIPLPISTTSAAISRDGRHIVYSADGQLYLRALDKVDPVPIPSGEGPLGSVFLSPDGEWIGYSDFRTSTLKKIRMSGGTPTTITALRDVPSGTLAASWGSNGTIVLSSSVQHGLLKVSDNGGPLEPLLKPAAGLYGAPHFLPNGRAVLVDTTVPEKPETIGVLALDTGEYKTLIQGRSPRFSTGHLIFFRDGALWAVGFDDERLEVSGSPLRLLDVPTDEFDLAANGTLMYLRGVDLLISKRMLVWVNRSGQEEPIVAPRRGYLYPAISPDNSRIAVDVRETDGISDIWLWDIARQTLAKQTFDARLDTYPVWSRDGRYLIFASTRDSAENLPNIYRVAADGAGQVERLTTSEYRQEPLAFSPDGQYIVFRHVDPKTGPDLMMLSTDGRVTPLVATQFSERNAAISPDGRWLAYESNDTGAYEIYVRPFPDVNSRRWLVSTSGGTRPAWSRNGGELFYITGKPTGPAALMAVPVESGTTFRAGTPHQLFSGDYDVPSPGNIGRYYDVSPDGQRFLLTKTDQQQGEPSAGELIVMQNWLSQVTHAQREKVPN